MRSLKLRGTLWGGEACFPVVACVGTAALARLSPSPLCDLEGSVKVKFIKVLDKFSLPAFFFTPVPLSFFTYVFSLCVDSPCHL